MDRNISINTDLNGRKVVMINDIRFKGKRKIDWTDVENYLKKYIGKIYEIENTQDKIYIGKDLPDEFSGSEDTSRLKGALAKAKANAAQVIPELIEIAINKRYKENLSVKHKANAKYGWYRFDSRFALPVYDEKGEVERYNVFCVGILIRHADDNRKYLYDLVNIKKKRAPRLSIRAVRLQTHFFSIIVIYEHRIVKYFK